LAQRALVAGAALGAGLLGGECDELGEEVGDDHGCTGAVPGERGDDGGACAPPASTDCHASCLPISASARTSSVLPGSMRCQVDAPDGWGRAITSNATPASSPRRGAPTTSTSWFASGTTCAIASLPTGITRRGRSSSTSRA